MLRDLSVKDIQSAHEAILQKVLEQINSILYFGGHELRAIGKVYQVCNVGEVVAVAAPAVKIIDRAYIKDLAGRANKDIDEGNYQGPHHTRRNLLLCY